jgi:4-alpha-glucanotransferase
VKPGKLNTRSHHLSCIVIGEDVGNVDDSIPDVHLFHSIDG